MTNPGINIQVTMVRSGLDEALRLLQQALDSLRPLNERGQRVYDERTAFATYAASRIEDVIQGLETSAEMLDESGLVWRE
jgi:hypothetical protein